MGRTSHSLKAEFSESNTVRPRQPGFACDEPNQGSSSTVNCVLGFGVCISSSGWSVGVTLNRTLHFLVPCLSVLSLAATRRRLVRVVPATGACGGRVYSQVAAVGVANPSQCGRMRYAMVMAG